MAPRHLARLGVAALLTFTVSEGSLAWPQGGVANPPPTRTKVVARRQMIAPTHCRAPEYGPAPPCRPSPATKLVAFDLKLPGSTLVELVGSALIHDEGLTEEGERVRLLVTVDGQTLSDVGHAAVEVGTPALVKLRGSRRLSKGSHEIALSALNQGASDHLSVKPAKLGVRMAAGRRSRSEPRRFNEAGGPFQLLLREPHALADRRSARRSAESSRRDPRSVAMRCLGHAVVGE